MRIRWEHKSRTVVFSCGTYADKSKWDNERQKAMKGTVHVVGTHSCSAREINASIAEINEIIDEAFVKFGLTALPPSVMEMKEFVKGRLDEIHPQKGKFSPTFDSFTEGLVHIRSLGSIFDDFITDMKDSLKWRDKYTEYHYRQVRNNVQECINQSVKHASISIGEIDTLSLAAELLIRLKRPEEALKYADKEYSIAIEQFEDSVELIYASELYGVCLQVCKRYDEAKECYAETLKDIDYEITNLERLRHEITTNFEEMSKQEIAALVCDFLFCGVILRRRDGSDVCCSGGLVDHLREYRL